MIKMIAEKKSKIVRDVDNNVWNDFVSFCKKGGMKVGSTLSDALRFFMKEKNKEGVKEYGKQSIDKPRV